jgi:hypothetical protein
MQGPRCDGETEVSCVSDAVTTLAYSEEELAWTAALCPPVLPSELSPQLSECPAASLFESKRTGEERG